MALMVLKADTISVLDDGKIGVALKAHLDRVARDCLDRPGEGKARKVTLSIAVVPVSDDKLNADRVSVQFEIKSSLPTHRTRVYDLALRANGSMLFSEESPDNVDQRTIFDDKDD